MNKKNLAKRVFAGVFYIVGILFALYIVMKILINGNRNLNLSGLIICIIGVCLPIAAASFLFISSIQEAGLRLKVMKVSSIIIFVFYDILLIYELFLNERHFRAISTMSVTEYARRNTNFIPFKTIGQYIQSSVNGSINKSIITENLLGNILAFAPMGILLPYIFQSLRNFKKFIFVMIIILISVEIGQLITRTGSCDIDDVILNLSGAILFFWLWSLNLTQKILGKMYV